MQLFKCLSTGFIIFNLVACIPYPVYKTIRPDVNFLVTDSDKKPIDGVKIVINTRANPTPINDFDIQYTNLKGMTTFAGKKVMKLENTAMHGALNYYCNLCIEKSGFKTINQYSLGSSDLSGVKVIKLMVGNSESCVAGAKR